MATAVVFLALTLASFIRAAPMLATTTTQQIHVVPVGTARMGSMWTRTQTSTGVTSSQAAPVAKFPSKELLELALGFVIAPTPPAMARHVATEVVRLALTLASFTRDAPVPATATTQQIHVVPVGTARMGSMLTRTQTSTAVPSSQAAPVAKFPSRELTALAPGPVIAWRSYMLLNF